MSFCLGHDIIMWYTKNIIQQLLDTTISQIGDTVTDPQKIHLF